MKSIKKRFKLLLREIEATASELVLLSSEVSVLQDMWEAANKVLNACEALAAQASRVGKEGFVDAMADAEALGALGEMVDGDVIGMLEERYFAGGEGREAGELWQQLLEKIEKRYVRMLDDIQRLVALLEEG